MSNPKSKRNYLRQGTGNSTLIVLCPMTISCIQVWPPQGTVNCMYWCTFRKCRLVFDVHVFGECVLACSSLRMQNACKGLSWICVHHMGTKPSILRVRVSKFTNSEHTSVEVSNTVFWFDSITWSHYQDMLYAAGPYAPHLQQLVSRPTSRSLKQHHEQPLKSQPGSLSRLICLIDFGLCNLYLDLHLCIQCHP